MPNDSLRMIRRLPASLRNPFWTEFIETVEEEFLRFKTQVEIKRTLYDAETADYTRLLELSELLGVLFNATVNDSIEFLREEVKAIPFKIKNKSTIRLYQSFFRSLDRDGEIFVYFFKTSSNNIVRNSSFILNGISLHDPLIPWKHTSTGDFTGFVEDALRLDQLPVQQLDIEDELGDAWTLDTVDTEISTNHIALEYFIDRIITKRVRDEETGVFEEREFLMTWEYMDFITVNTNFSRRAKEVPHVGSQLGLITDNSGVFNPIDDEYSQPSIKSKVLVDPTILNALSSVIDINYMEFGIGGHTDLTNRLGGGTFPTSLETRVARNFILFDEKFEIPGEWMAVTTEYKGQEINTFVIHDDTGYILDNDPNGSGAVNGVNNEFNGTLPFAPIQKRNVQFKFISDELTRTFQDDGNGNLVGEFAEGTIDYNSGEYWFTTDFNFSDDRVLFTGDGEETNINVTIGGLENPIIPGSVILRYNVFERWYIAYDDGAGNITGTNISSGSVDYSTGEFTFEFTNPLTNGEELTVEFEWNRVTTPDAGTDVLVDFYFTIRRIEITEAAIYNNNDEMIAYATFPPIEFNTSEHHVNIDFNMKLSPFTT